MKYLAILFISGTVIAQCSLGSSSSGGNSYTDKKANLSASDLNRIVQDIWIVEGGAKSKYPYGIEIRHHHYTTAEAKAICEHTVANNYRRWQADKKSNDFITYLASKYCPVNKKNWAKNLNNLLSRESKR
jgi:hypothetical protein